MNYVDVEYPCFTITDQITAAATMVNSGQVEGTTPTILVEFDGLHWYVNSGDPVYQL